MKKIYKIGFSDGKAKKGQTKFGGHPDWINEPEWPISKETGNPMRFICQIDLRKIGFINIEPEFAYLFMTDEEEYVDGTWEPNGGENAIILQPGKNISKTQRLETGPTLYKMVKKLFKSRLVPEGFESQAILREFVEDDLDPDYLEIENKIGGQPMFIQGEEFPDDGNWELLIQLDSTNVPFYINFGDAGVGYGFISSDGNRAKFLWQCL